MANTTICVRYLTLAAVLATASACDRTPATAPGAQPSVPPRERITERPPDGAMSGQELSRRNTPWRGMSDQELAQQISEARGHVLIGFKAIGALEGVNDSGRVWSTLPLCGAPSSRFARSERRLSASTTCPSSQQQSRHS